MITDGAKIPIYVDLLYLRNSRALHFKPSKLDVTYVAQPLQQCHLCQAKNATHCTPDTDKLG